MHANEKTAWERRLFASASAMALCCALSSPSLAGAIDITSKQNNDANIVQLPRMSAPLEWATYESAKYLPTSVAQAANTVSASHSKPMRPRPSPLQIVSLGASPMDNLSTYKPVSVRVDVARRSAIASSPQQASVGVQKKLSALETIAALKKNEPSEVKAERVARVDVKPSEKIIENNQHQTSPIQPHTVPIWQVLDNEPLAVAELESAAGEAEKAAHAHQQDETIAAVIMDDDDVLTLTPPKVVRHVGVVRSEQPPIQTKTVIAEIQLASEEQTQPLWESLDEQKFDVAALEPAAGEPVDLMPPSVPKAGIVPEKAAEAPLPRLNLPNVDPPVAQEVEIAPPVATNKELPLKVQPSLSEESKAVLDNLPAERVSGKAKKEVKLERSNKAGKESEDIKKHEVYGMKISVKRPQMDVFRMLESAYNSLIAGDQQYAITLYKEVLEVDPENTLALFGLATTYHRAGQPQLARPLYGKLLKIDPHNVEGLNNFLVLLADESPDAALVELEKLRHSHPSFSPVLAQMALIYERQGDYTKASEKLAQAYAISPENLKYQYNMAIVLDKMKDWEEAAKWYQRLLTAGQRGEKIPGNAQEIQQRLTFIRSNTSSVN